ncbi:stage II sporulation protein P [Virgibacillus dakarensis]|nr:stage II sporulation protein P [Virgibacillus dakarensis]
MKQKKTKQFNQLYKRSGLYVLCVLILFVSIGIMTSLAPAYRFSSHVIAEWTSEIESTLFLHLLGMENRAFQQAYPEDKKLPKLSTTLFHMATSIKPNDPRSLLGNELPGFSTFDTKIIVAGEGTDYTTLPIESSPPLEEILKDREAVLDEPEESDDSAEKDKKDKPTTGDRDVVFLYNTHNRESFLPHLPGVTDGDLAQHDTVNITKVSDRLAKTLKANGIGTSVDHTDIMTILNEKGWEYPKSYDASRGVVKEAFQNNKDIKYAFDIHRDSLSGDKTTAEIDGKKYAKIMIVIGNDNSDKQTNLALATELHKRLEKKYPGLSRGVIKRGGAGANGVYNQDLMENALLFEFGGVDNTFEELYRSADAMAEIFSDFYWDAEKVNAESKEE